MRNGPSALLVLAALSGGTCAATGIGYASNPDLSPPPVGIWLLTLSLLGASALVAVGIWQSATDGGLRVLLLLLLAGLAAGYVSANAFGLVIADQLPGAPRALNMAGLALGGVAYLGALTAATLEFLARRRASG